MGTKQVPGAFWQQLCYGANGLLDLVYPPGCLVCERYGTSAVCPACEAAFMPLPEPVCAVCGRADEPDPTACRACIAAGERGGWGFDAARASGVYAGALRHALHRLKYGRIEPLGEMLGAYLANRCVVDGLFGGDLRRDVDLVIPVPIHRARQWDRGFNQAALLAAPVAAMIGKPLATSLLVRVRRTPPQVGLSGEARRRNLEDAFAVTDAAKVSGRPVLLIDDVFTTGSTATACAFALKRAGAGAVRVATLASGR